MLYYAYPYKDEILKLYLAVSINLPNYKYYEICGYVSFTIDFKNDDWSKIEKVSIHNNKILSYMTASVNRFSKIITNVSWISLQKEVSIVSCRDMYSFVIDDLFKKNQFRKLSFEAITENPANKFYKYICQKYPNHAHIAGTLEDEFILTDGKYYDAHMYEFKNPFIPNNELRNKK